MYRILNCGTRFFHIHRLHWCRFVQHSGGVGVRRRRVCLDISRLVVSGKPGIVRLLATSCMQLAVEPCIVLGQNESDLCYIAKSYSMLILAND